MPHASAEAQRAWRAKNPGRATEYARKWRAAHPEYKPKRVGRKYKNQPAPTRAKPAHCECCGTAASGYSMHLDHCHITGVFRGWLCVKCNLGIGNLGDNIEGVENAVNYLRRLK